MFPTVFSGYNTVTLVQPVFPAQPPFHPTFVLLQPIPIVFAPIQLPVQKFSPQGILDDVYGRTAEKEVPSTSPITSGSATSPCSRSPCSSQESSSGYSSEGENDINGIVQYNFREEPPLPKRLPIFERIHRRGLMERMKAQKLMSRKFKTSLCKFFRAGNCDRGSNCAFAHGVGELRVPELPPNYRTRPCVNYMLRKYCRLGKRCDFVHEM